MKLRRLSTPEAPVGTAMNTRVATRVVYAALEATVMQSSSLDSLVNGPDCIEPRGSLQYDFSKENVFRTTKDARRLKAGQYIKCMFGSRRNLLYVMTNDTTVADAEGMGGFLVNDEGDPIGTQRITRFYIEHAEVYEMEEYAELFVGLLSDTLRHVTTQKPSKNFGKMEPEPIAWPIWWGTP